MEEVDPKTSPPSVKEESPPPAAAEQPETGDGILVFAINGERFEVPEIDPSTTLLHFLRSKTRFKSAKLSCGEGGCGACVVLLSKYDPVLKQVEDFSISSCLTLLCSINGCSITTSEGLGNSKDGFHPIHQRFAGFHASQCGFCSPGMCMSFFSALKNAEKTNRAEPPQGFSKLTVSEAERAIAGNLCRCTGYRPIADACKSFTADVDLEDLGLNSFWKKGETNEIAARKLPYYDANKVCTYPEFLKDTKTTKALDSKTYSWYSPATLEDLRTLLKSDLVGNSMFVKLVAGSTGVGYFKETEPFEKYINLRNIPELSTITKNHLQLEIGAAVPISKVIAVLKDDELDLSSDAKQVFRKMGEHMEKIASGFIRNSASIGGNIVMAQRSQFPSDIVTILLAVNSTVTITSVNKDETMELETFLAGPPLDSRSVLLSVHIPLLKPQTRRDITGTDSRLLFNSYRASPRHLGNALPYLNAAFLADMSCCEHGVLVNSVQLSFGAYGTKHALRARRVEDYLSGKVLSAAVLYEALKLIKASIMPEDGTSYPAYRTSLAVGFVFQFLFPYTSGYSTLDSLPEEPTYCLLETSTGHNNGYLGDLEKSALLSSGRQEVEYNSEYFPVGEPMVKSGASLQASGEAVYVDDIPSPPSCLHGAFVYSTKPLARINGIDLKPTLQGGVNAVLSFEDIPKGGENVGCKTMFGFEPLFADEITRCTGEPIAFVVAETQKHADIAANTAVVKYDVQNMDPPILTVEEAVRRSSFIDVPPFLQPKPVGDFSKGMAEADHQILSAEIRLGSQYYFYMETQTALAVPDEDNCMVVYSSTQSPEAVQSTIANCLGVPEHNIRVITRRVGGGFGGKAMKSMPVATACALAAHKLRRPVRIYLNRKTDMIMTAGRNPMKVTYSVGYKSNGKITALHLEILINAGTTPDISPVLPSNMVGTLKKYNWGAFSFDFKVCKTNHCSKSAMRAPGEMQASFIAESIIEHVAALLSMDVDSVRKINIHTYDSLEVFYGQAAGEAFEYTLPNIWEKLATSSNLEQRYRTIEQFNLSNKWRKRGISRVPIVNEVFVRPGPGKVSILSDGSISVEVGGIELGQGLWTKVKQMAAFALSSIKCAGTEDLVEKIRVVQSDTLSLVQGGFTAGSTTSETSCEAVRLCCNILVERLSPVLEGLTKQTNPVNWDVLIQQAQLQAVNLAANSYFAPDFSSMRYLNYGAAVSEVEINLLTGDTTILQADIIYDCGQSMNPAVDLGQIEGAFVQGIGFFLHEEYLTNDEGLAVMDGTWTYKIPTIDTIPKQLNVEVLNSGHHKKRVLSSKASGEPPLLLAASIHCAIRAAVKEARRQLRSWMKVDEPDSTFQLKVPALMPVVKEAAGLDIVEKYLESLLTS